VSGIVVEASQTIAINRQLELAKTSQLVEVTAEVPLVQTATSDLGFQVDAKTIQNAALVDRDGTLVYVHRSTSPRGALALPELMAAAEAARAT